MSWLGALTGRSTEVSSGRCLTRENSLAGVSPQEALPHSLRRAELARSLRQTARLYRDLVAGWAARTGATPPSPPLAPAVLDALNQLVAGNGERIEP